MTTLYTAINELPRRLQDFLPRTLDERKAKLTERMNQAWPTFYLSGDWSYKKLWLHDHDNGTVIRFFAGTPVTFDSIGAVKHGAFWYLSEPINEMERFDHRQMLTYLEENKLNWVVLL